MAARFGNNDRLCNALGNAVQGLHGVANPFAVVAAGQEPAEGWAEENEPYFRERTGQLPRARSPRAKTGRVGAPGVLAIASRSVVTQCLALRRSIRFSV